MKTSIEGLALIEKREGLRTNMYLDSAGLQTIGVGHLLTKDELMSGKISIGGQPVKWRAGLTVGQVTALLDQDLAVAERAVAAVRVTLSQQQHDTLVSFAFNIGPSAFASSTLLRKLNAGDYEAVEHELGRWVHAAGQVDPILQKRRQSEIEQWRSVPV